MVSSPPGLSEFVDAQPSVTVVFDACLYVLASNTSAREAWGALRPGENIARSVFLDPDLDEALDAGEVPAAQVVELLRECSTDQAADWQGVALIGELMSQSSTFARMWAHPTPLRPVGTIRVQDTKGAWKVFHYEVAQSAGDPQVRVMTWSPPLAPAPDADLRA